jgi:AraC-like DNA-binding protein
MATNGTVCVWAARPAVVALRARGLAEEAVIRAAGLSPHALENAEARLPVAAVNQLWELAASAAGDPLFGVHVAASLIPGSADVLEYLGSASPTLGQAYERVARYSRVFYDRSNLTLIVEPRHARLVRRDVAPAAQYCEFVSAYLVARGRLWTGAQWRPERVTFQHARPAARKDLAIELGCPVEFSAAELEISFARELLDLPHLHADSRLLDILVRYANTLVAAVPDPGDLAARAAASIARQLSSTVPTLSSTAAALRLHPRTLQRRLADHASTHALVVDEVRRSLALKYIVDAGISIDEIAYLLRFSDGTAFYRAFKRWTGESPRQYRRHALGSS